MSNYNKTKMNKARLDESRVYEENGVVKVRHLIHDSPIVDMTPHPTESRAFVKDGEVVTVDSEEISKTGTMSVEKAKQTHFGIHKKTLESHII
jgi:hypothetical protein